MTLAKLKSSCDLNLLLNKASTWSETRLPRAHSLLRHGQHGMGLQRAVEGLVHGQQDLFLRGQGILVFSFGGIIGAGGQIRGASKVGNQLA